MMTSRFPAYLRIIGTSPAPAVQPRGSSARLPVGGAAVLSREDLLARLALIGELAPDSPLSFVVVKVFGLGELNRELGWRACESVLGTVAGELGVLIRATDVVGRMTGSSFGIVLQGTGATAASAVEARLSYRLNRLPGVRHPAQVVVSAATGTGLNADTLPGAAMDSFDEDAV